MTARFLLHLREWDDHMSNPETDQWNRDARSRGGGGGVGDHGPIRFKKSEHRSTKWTVNLSAVLGDDPLLRPLESEVHSRGEHSGGKPLPLVEA